MNILEELFKQRTIRRVSMFEQSVLFEMFSRMSQATLEVNTEGMPVDGAGMLATPKHYVLEMQSFLQRHGYDVSVDEDSTAKGQVYRFRITPKQGRETRRTR